MPTAGTAYKQQLLLTISSAYEKGAIASTEESSAYVPMARNIRDQRGQASRYSAVISTYASLQNSDEDLGDVLGDVGEKISRTADSVAGSIDAEVGRAGQYIGERLNYVSSFATENQDIHSTVLGGEIKNTLATMAGQDNLGDALKTLLADCIPCDGRITAGFEVDIAGNLKDQIELDIINRINYLKNALSFSASKDIYSDICSLVNSFNFMCVPDLARILSLLTFLLGRYSLKIGDMSSVLMGLVQAIFQPVLVDLQGIFDQYAQLVMRVIDCVIDSMNEQVTKLQVYPKTTQTLEDSWEKFKEDWSSLGISSQSEWDEYKRQSEIKAKQRAKELKEERANPKSSDLDEVQKTLDGLSESAASGLQEVSNMIGEARDSLNTMINMLSQQADAFFAEWFLKSGEGVGFSIAKLKITRVLGLIQALIQFKSLGNICDGKTFQAEELNVFVNTYVNPATSAVNLKVSADGVTIESDASAKISAASDNIIQITTAQIASIQTGDITSTQIAQLEALESGLDTGTLSSSVSVSFDECLYGAGDSGSEKVQKWIRELTNA